MNRVWQMIFNMEVCALNLFEWFGGWRLACAYGIDSIPVLRAVLVVNANKREGGVADGWIGQNEKLLRIQRCSSVGRCVCE